MTENAPKDIPNRFSSDFENRTVESEILIDSIVEALFERKAEDVTLIDVRGLTTLTDYFVVCHANADVQIKALADNVTDKTIEQLNEKAWRKEGLETRRWVVLDYVNVVVHIFLREQREFYNLERMWSDAEITHLEDIPNLKYQNR